MPPRPEIPPVRQITDPGGEVITVEVRRNGIINYLRETVLTEERSNRQFIRYRTDDGEVITVRRNDTIKDIAARLLRDRGDRV